MNEFSVKVDLGLDQLINKYLIGKTDADLLIKNLNVIIKDLLKTNKKIDKTSGFEKSIYSLKRETLLHVLVDGVSIAKESGCNEVDIDKRFLIDYMDNISYIESEDIKKLWSQLLAKEIINHSSENIKLITFLKTITEEDIKLIVTMMDYTVDQLFLTSPILHRNTFLSNLRELGLIDSESMTMKIKPNMNYKIELSWKNKIVEFIISNKSTKEIRLSNRILTQRGNLLMRICNDIETEEKLKNHISVLKIIFDKYNLNVDKITIEDKS